MKKVYLIYENGYGSTGIFFTDKDESLEFAKIREDYSVRENSLYENVNEYKSMHKENYVKLLKRQIEKLKDKIDYFTSGNALIEIKIYDNSGRHWERFSIESKNINSILKDKEIPSGVLHFSSEFSTDYNIISTKSDCDNLKKYLPEFTQACIKSVKEFDENKKLLEKYKKELVAIKIEDSEEVVTK